MWPASSLPVTNRVYEDLASSSSTIMRVSSPAVAIAE